MVMAEIKLNQYIFTFALRVLNAAGQIALSFIILKAYGVEKLGIFTIFLSNTMLTTLLARQGYDRTIILFQTRKRLSRYTNQLFYKYIKHIALIAPLAGGINLAAYAFATDGLPETGLLFIIILLPFVVAISFMVAGYFIGAGNIVAATIQQPGFSAGITTIAIAVAISMGLKPDLLIVFFVSTCLVAVLGIIHILLQFEILRGSGIEKIARDRKGVMEISRNTSMRYLFINLFTTFSSVYFFAYLALFVTPAEIGSFRAVERLAMVIAFNLSFINIIMPGNAIKLFNTNERFKFDQAIRNTFLFQYVTGLGLFVSMIIFKEPVMLWIEVDSMVLFTLPLLAQLINALTGPVRVILMYLGGQKILQTSVALETLGSMILYWVCYKLYGVDGLAMGYFIAIATPNLLLALIVYRMYGIIPFPLVRVPNQ